MLSMTHCIDISNSHRPSVHQSATRFEPRGTHTPQVITNHQGDSTVHSHKERPKVMTKRHESTGSGDSFSEILAADRALDAIGRGELSAAQTDDPILALLADARGQSERSMPPAPDLATLLGDDWTDTTDPVTPMQSGYSAYPVSAEENSLTEDPGQNRALRRGVSALAAGSASASAMLIAGGVAAALAVGGLGYAAYTTTQEKLTKDTPGVNSDDGDSSRASSSRNSRTTSTDGSTTRSTSEPNVAPADPTRASTAAPSERDAAPTESKAVETTVTGQDALPTMPSESTAATESVAPSEQPGDGTEPIDAPKSTDTTDGTSAARSGATDASGRSPKPTSTTAPKRPAPGINGDVPEAADAQGLLGPLTQAAEAARLRNQAD